MLYVIIALICVFLLLRGTIRFVLKPLKTREIVDFSEIEPEIDEGEVCENDTLNVKIVGGKIDSSKIKEYKGETIKQFEFRPQNFSQFIGQTEAKERAKTIMQKANQKIRCHFLVDGIKGHGKTTFVELLAKSLDARLIQRIGKQVDEDEIVNIINEINESKEKYTMVFIDEFDTMDWKIIKLLNPIIEQFKINGKNIKPFIFAGATINKHLLIKNNPDTLDRIPTHIKFARYNAEEIAMIVKQYREQLYSNKNVSNEVIKAISENCKYNPRTSIGLLEEYIVTQNIKKVLQVCNIVKNGLTNIDISVLDILNKATRPVGCNALAMKCKLSQEEYLREFEPFLVEYDYVNRIPSRVITEKGKALLKEI